MPSSRQPVVPSGPSSFLHAVQSDRRNLKERYKGKPLELAERLGVKLPRKPVLLMIELGVITEEEAEKRFGKITPGLREFVEDVCTLAVKNAVAVANRGGGKSFGVSFVEFYLWAILDFDALNLGGSELQADQVYQYLLGYLESDPFWLTLIRGEPQRERTYKKNDAWVRVLTASQKSVRSPHAGGFRKGLTRGGVLVIDEEAEAEKDIVEAALPTINTAKPSVSCRVSTFHNLEGSFQEVVDNHEEMGYTLYKWDIFDVAERCDCVGSCQSPEPCFREDHIERYTDPDTGEDAERIVHRAYCGGRAMYADGWVAMSEIITLFKRMRRNHNRWEIEAMGSRPSSAGFVIKDLTKHAQNITTETTAQLFRKGSPVTICVDWGTGAAGLSVWQEQFGNKHVQLHSDLMMDNNETQILGAILGYVAQYRGEFLEVAADIGGGGNYLNKKLRDEHRIPVRDVNFGEEKEAAVAAWNIMNESGDVVYPEGQDDFHHQVRNWKRKNGRIAKGNDHLCDANVCYFSKFIDRFGLTNVRITPRSFSSNGDVRVNGKNISSKPSVKHLTGRRPRVPVVRTFGSGKTKRR